jgi:hypothetical protein
MTVFLKDNRNVDGRAPNPDKVAWRIAEWCPAVGISRAQTYELIAEGAISSVKLGSARIITTTPASFSPELAPRCRVTHSR